MSIIVTLLFLVPLLNLASSKTSIQSDVEFLASDKLQGRLTGSLGNILVQDWLIKRLQVKSIRPAGDRNRTTFRSPFKNGFEFKTKREIEGTNILGIVYPKNIWTDEKPKVIIGAHFDHIDRCWIKFENPNQSCKGATDNATSVAIILSLLDSLAATIQAPVALAFWDAEEIGLLGSDAFLKSPSFDLDQVNAYLNLDIVGANLFRGLENHHVIIGSETGGNKMLELVSSATGSQKGKLNYHLLSYAFGHARSDMTSFVRHQRQIPILFFSDGDGAVYHSNSDEPKNVNFNKVQAVADVLLSLTQKISSLGKADFSFQAPNIYMDEGSFWQDILNFLFRKKNFIKTGIAIPHYSDLSEIENLYSLLLENVDKNKFDPTTVEEITKTHTELKLLKSRNDKSLSLSEKYSLLKAAVFFTNYSKKLTFIP